MSKAAPGIEFVPNPTIANACGLIATNIHDKMMVMNSQNVEGINTLTTTDPVENEWKRLYIITEQWQSDISFFADESAFMNSLIDKHFMKLTKNENMPATKAAVARLGKLENRRFNLQQKVDRHYHHMSGLIQYPFPRDAQAYRDEHERLEAAMGAFVRDFRALKKEIFALARQVMNEERTNHLLN